VSILLVGQKNGHSLCRQFPQNDEEENEGGSFEVDRRRIHGGVRSHFLSKERIEEEKRWPENVVKEA